MNIEREKFEIGKAMAVIFRTECSRKSIRIGKMLQGSIIFVVLVLVGGGFSQGCDQARKDIVAAGFPASAVIDKPTEGKFSVFILFNKAFINKRLYFRIV